MKSFTVLTSFLILAALIFQIPAPLEAAKPSLTSLEQQFREYQAKTDYKNMARVLEQMLAQGYKSVKRYKTLGDLYFYIKQDEKALTTFNRQAQWANTPELWINYSNLLFWKKKDKEGLFVLERAYSNFSNHDGLAVKLAQVYEYKRMIKKSEKIWLKLYDKKGRSLQAGKTLVDFYLRNGQVNKARDTMDELHRKDPDLNGAIDMKILHMKVNAWTSRTREAFAALRRLKISDIPEADLQYTFSLALYGGDLNYAESILNRLKKMGKDVWKNRLAIFIIKGDPSATRELIEEKIDDVDEPTVDLLNSLYETYRAERQIEGEIDTLERILELDYRNPKWQDLLMQYYLYSQDYDRGVDILEDIIDDHEDAQLAVLNLARLHLFNQDFEDFYETIKMIEDETFISRARELRFQTAIVQNDWEKRFEVTREILENLENISPEEKVKQLKESNDPGYDPEGSMPGDRFLELLLELYGLAEELGKTEERSRYGREAFGLLKERFAEYPSQERLQVILALVVEFGSAAEHELYLLEGRKFLSDTDYYLSYYRFLMKQGRYPEAKVMLRKLLISPQNMDEHYQVSEHTFGFVPYNLSKKLFRNIIARDSSYSMGLKRLGQIALYTDKYQEAIFYLEKYLAINSFDPESIFLLGEAKYYNNQPFEAEERFERVIELFNYPNLPVYETELLAICYIRLGKEEVALELLKSASIREPKNLSIKYNILETLVLLEQWQEAMDLMDKENLDDPLKLKTAKELIFQSNLEHTVKKTEYVDKSSFEFEELQAIVDIQLFLRFQIVRHLCLQGLGRYNENKIILDMLYRKNPVNKEILATIGFFYAERGEDEKAMYYLDRALKIPPNDQGLNQSYRELIFRYSPLIQSGFSWQERKSDGGQNESRQYEYTVSGASMVTTTDSIDYSLSHYRSIQEEVMAVNQTTAYTTIDGVTTVSSEDSSADTQAGDISRTVLNIRYNGNISFNDHIPLLQRYHGDLFLRERLGYRLGYSVATIGSSIRGAFSYFDSNPLQDSYEHLYADAYSTGYEIELGFQVRKLAQGYDFSYLNQSYIFGNNSFAGNPWESRFMAGFSQDLMTYPNRLNLNTTYSESFSLGELEQTDPETLKASRKHFVSPSVQTEVSATFQHYWNEFFNTSFIFSSIVGDNKEYETTHIIDQKQKFSANAVSIDFGFLSDTWSVTGSVNYSIENQGEKIEISSVASTDPNTSTIVNTITETAIPEKTTTTFEMGSSIQIRF